MPQAYRSEPSLLPIERPLPEVSGPHDAGADQTWPAHADLLTFECRKCEHVHKALVEDPMNSGNAGWQNSDLKPPK